MAAGEGALCDELTLTLALRVTQYHTPEMTRLLLFAPTTNKHPINKSPLLFVFIEM